MHRIYRVICVENEREQRKNEIIYDEGFHSASQKIEKADEIEPVPIDEQPRKEKEEKYKPMLITIQLVLCLLLALSLFLLKSTGSAYYTQFKAWYDGEMKKTLISEDALDTARWEAILSPATADEAAPERD